ncbi:MAG: HD domain-containing protein [Sedimentisphaerales bacterium]
MSVKKIDDVRRFVEYIFAESTQRSYYEHTLRVYRFAYYIGEEENADMEILLPAVLMHDIGMTIDTGFPRHVDKSAYLAKMYLKSNGYPSDKTYRILQVITSHHIPPYETRKNKEEEVIFDADTLEIVGGYGILRWLGKSILSEQTIVDSINLFSNIVKSAKDKRGSLFFTETAKKLGDKSVEESLEYYRRIIEYFGTCKSYTGIISPVEI